MLRSFFVTPLLRKVNIQPLKHCLQLRTICKPAKPKKWSYVSGHSDHPLIGSTIGELLESLADKHPDKNAFVFTHQQSSLTYEQLLTESDKVAAGLRSLGTERGDRVGIWAHNCKEWIITMFAAARAGFILVNINSSYQPAELEYCLKNVGVRVLVMAEKLKEFNNYEKLLKACPSIASSPNINDAKLPDLRNVVIFGEKEYPGTISFDDLRTKATDKEVQEVSDLQHSLQFDDDINIQFTSGTTGRPKGATLTHHNILNNCLKIGHRLKFHENETIICSPVPLFHTMGMVIAALQSIVSSSTIVIPSYSFSPLAAIQAVHNLKCTTILGTPTMYIDFLNLPNLCDFDLTSLDNGVVAGSVCPEEVMRKLVNDMNMKHMANCYGTTENSPITFQSMYEDDFEKRTTTVGKVHDYVEAKIVDRDGHVVEVGETGELWTRGYMVMKGYWQDEAKTKDTMHDTWYKTGDLASFDEEGYCKIIGRKKDMIIRGGENVYPAEIEEVLYEHPNVKDVQIIGVPDQRLGEQIAAWIVLKHKEASTVQDILDYCKQQMAYFKVPKYVRFVDKFPMTATGKIQKYKMREEAVELYKPKD